MNNETLLNNISEHVQQTETVEQVTAYMIKKLNAVSLLKVQKLLYYTCAFYYTLNNRHIHNNVPVEFQAWVEGPANPHVYSMYRNEYSTHDSIPYNDAMDYSKLNETDRRFIDDVLDLLGDKSGVFLETFSHTEEPWIESRDNLPEFASSRALISYDTIKEYYQDKVSVG